MKFSLMSVLTIPVILAACSNDAGSPTYLTNAVTKPPVFSPQASLVPDGCVKFRATGYQSFVEPAWSGHQYTMIGGQEVVGPGAAGGGELTQRAFERLIKGLPYRGDETATFTYEDGDIYAVDSFTAQPGDVPGLWNYHATGKFTGGTGRYTDATGAWEAQGPFLMYPALPGPNDGVALLTYVGHICLK